MIIWLFKKLIGSVHILVNTIPGFTIVLFDVYFYETIRPCMYLTLFCGEK